MSGIQKKRERQKKCIRPLISVDRWGVKSSFKMLKSHLVQNLFLKIKNF